MKKNLFLFLTAAISAALIFSSCSDFMNGDQLKDSLDSAIEYAEMEAVPVLISADEGTGVSSPNSYVDVKNSDIITLRFNANRAYFFKGWKCINVDSGEEVKGAVVFADEKSAETTVKIVNICKNLKIVPDCIERPKVISGIPAYNSYGVYRDTRIRVQFSKPMSEESIYYTKTEADELEEKYNLGKSSTENPEAYFLASEKNSENRYGYVINGEVTFKNIKISNLADGTNLLSNYSEPYFTNSKTLIIPTKSEDYAPAENTDIYVKILSGMKNEGSAELLESYEWPYLVNGNIDKTAPEISTVEIDVCDGNGNIKTTSDNPSVKYITGKDSKYTNSNTYYVGEDYISVKAKATDDESCISEAYLQLEQVLDVFGTVPSESEEKSIAVKTIVLGNTATCDDKIKINKTSDLNGGTYKITFVVSDNSGHKTEWTKGYWYIVTDYCAPEFNSVSVLPCDKGGKTDSASYPSSAYVKKDSRYSSNPVYFLKEDSLKIDLNVSDEETGVNWIKAKIEKVQEKTYTTGSAAGVTTSVAEEEVLFQTSYEKEGDEKDTSVIVSKVLDFSAYKDGLYKVSLFAADNFGNEVTWPAAYYTTCDYVPPSFTSTNVSRKKYSGESMVDGTISPLSSISKWASLKDCNAADGKITVSGTVSDVETPPESVTISIQKCYDASYKAVSSAAVTETLTLTKDDESSAAGTYSKDFDLTSSEYGEGVYKIQVIATEKSNGSQNITSYYVVYDKPVILNNFQFQIYDTSNLYLKILLDTPEHSFVTSVDSLAATDVNSSTGTALTNFDYQLDDNYVLVNETHVEEGLFDITATVSNIYGYSKTYKANYRAPLLAPNFYTYSYDGKIRTDSSTAGTTRATGIELTCNGKTTDIAFGTNYVTDLTNDKDYEFSYRTYEVLSDGSRNYSVTKTLKENPSAVPFSGAYLYQTSSEELLSRNKYASNCKAIIVCSTKQEDGSYSGWLSEVNYRTRTQYQWAPTSYTTQTKSKVDGEYVYESSTTSNGRYYSTSIHDYDTTSTPEYKTQQGLGTVIWWVDYGKSASPAWYNAYSYGNNWSLSTITNGRFTYTKWKIPTKTEFEKMVDVKTDLFDSSENSFRNDEFYWTSTEYDTLIPVTKPNGTSGSWYVDMVVFSAGSTNSVSDKASTNISRYFATFTWK